MDGNGTLFTYNLRFPGQYYDAESGLHYNVNRDYDPTTGRYIQADPIGLSGGLNLYSYAGANPESYIDPLGLDFGFGVDPQGAANNGHTTLYFQSGSGDWYSYDQGGVGGTSLGNGNAGVLLGLDKEARVEIQKVINQPNGPSSIQSEWLQFIVNYPPQDTVFFESSYIQDLTITQSAIGSMNAHNSGNLDYNLYSNNCTDAAVDVINNTQMFNIPNPAFTVKPNSWIDLINDQGN